MRFILFVEGDTEKRVLGEFIKRWLDPKLTSRVGIKIVNMQSVGNFQNEIANKIKYHLESPSGQDNITKFGLLDLYGLDIFPENKKTKFTRIKWGTDYFENQVVKQNKFKMFFAVHELEAWLLADKTIFPHSIQSVLPKMKPEEVNFTTPPAKQLKNAYRKAMKVEYKKIANGVDLFSKLDPEQVYAQCPNFKKMMNTMLESAKEAGC